MNKTLRLFLLLTLVLTGQLSIVAHGESFVAPFAGNLYIQCVGGDSAASSRFGTGTSLANFVPHLSGLPSSCSQGEVLVQAVSAGETVQFAMSTQWGSDTYVAFSGGVDTASLVAFSDMNGSLGLGGKVIQQTSQTTWRMNLDDAASYLVDDDDNDILIQIRLTPSGVSPSNPTKLDFEFPLPLGLASVSFWQGTLVPMSARITNQYASQGILMDGVALVYAGVGHAASGAHMLSGISPSGTVDYGAPLTFYLVNPTDGHTPALSDFFSVTTDRSASSGNVVTITGYDLRGLPAGSVSQVDTGNMTLRLQGAGRFHRVVVQASNPLSGGVGFDLVTFGALVTAPPYVLPQFCFGGGWYSALYFTNTGSSLMSIPIAFIGDDGNPLFVPSAGGSAVTLNLAPRGTAVFEAPNVGMLRQGYALVSLPSEVVGYGIFRSTSPGRDDQEAVVPLSPTSSTSSTLIWDETAFTTAVAIVNPSSFPNWVTVMLRDSAGAVIGTSLVPLSAKGKVAVALRDLPRLGAMAGRRGSAEFTVTTGNVAVLGLRFGGAAFTSIPAADR